MRVLFIVITLLTWACIARRLLLWDWASTGSSTTVVAVVALVVYGIGRAVHESRAKRRRLDPTSYLLDSDREWLRRHQWQGRR